MYTVSETRTGHPHFTSPSRLQLTGLHNPAESTVSDSVSGMQVQRVQRHLLRMIHSDYPDLMYPAALGCLADLEEVIKLNNLLCRTDALPQSCALDAGFSILYDKLQSRGICNLCLVQWISSQYLLHTLVLTLWS